MKKSMNFTKCTKTITQMRKFSRKWHPEFKAGKHKAKIQLQNKKPWKIISEHPQANDLISLFLSYDREFTSRAIAGKALTAALRRSSGAPPFLLYLFHQTLPTSHLTISQFIFASFKRILTTFQNKPNRRSLHAQSFTIGTD